MNEQIVIAVVSVMVGFFSAGFAGAGLLHSRSQTRLHELRARHNTTLEFYKIWMSGDMYHSRAIAGSYCDTRMGKTAIPFSHVYRNNPEASESIGRVMHFIVEIMAAQRAGLLDNNLARSLFQSTFVEWQNHLTLFSFSDKSFHQEYAKSISDAVTM